MTGTDSERTETIRLLGVRLRRLRVAYGNFISRPHWTMREMAKLLDVQEERYRTYERGEREPPLWLLIRISKVTGMSLDTLVTGAVTDPDGLYPEDAEDFEQGFEIARRLRAVRMIQTPNIEEAAEAMGVRADVLGRWESGMMRPGIRRLAEFAGRFSVSLDFLYYGHLETVLEPHVRSALRARLVQTPASDRDTATFYANDPSKQSRGRPAKRRIDV